MTAYDQMAINRPLTVDQPSLSNMVTGRGEGVGHRWDASLHTHHNQVRSPHAPLPRRSFGANVLLRKDGFGDSVFICYAILPLYDMNEKTGATSIAPASHTPENVAYINNYRRENAQALKDTSVSRHSYRWHLGCILLKMPAISLRTGAARCERGAGGPAGAAHAARPRRRLPHRGVAPRQPDARQHVRRKGAAD